MPSGTGGRTLRYSRRLPPFVPEAIPSTASATQYMRLTVFGSQPVSCAADHTVCVRSFALSTSTISQPDFVTGPLRRDRTNAANISKPHRRGLPARLVGAGRQLGADLQLGPEGEVRLALWELLGRGVRHGVHR